MKFRFLPTVLLVAVIGNMSIMIAAQKNVTDNIDETTPLIDIDKVSIDLTGWRKAIDKNKNQEPIPDAAAFTLFFRFIAGNQDADAKKRIQSYVKQIGLGKCKSCSIEANEERGTEQDLNALINAADEFQRRVSILDSQAVEIKRNNQPSPQVTAQLKQLQLQKESVVIEIVSSLHYKLTETGMNKVIQHINGRVKKNSTLKSERNSAFLVNQVEQPSDQYEYTDSYTIEEETKPEPVTDSETGEQTNMILENEGPAQLVGVGVTESTYDSNVYMVNTYTTIAVPSGAVISQSPVVSDYTYARAETIAQVDPETAEEGDYTVQSRHRYKYFYDGVEPSAGYETSKRTVRKKNSRSLQNAPSLCYGCGRYYYSTSFTYGFISYYTQTEAFIRDPYLDSVCIRAYRGALNNAYYPLCRISAFNGCRNHFTLCGRENSSFVAVITPVTVIRGYRICPFSRYLRSSTQPPCKNIN